MPLPSTPFTLPTLHRQAIFYALVFIGTGASLPYMPLWFSSKGLSGAEIGVILAVPLLLRAFTGPLVGVWADSFKLFRTPLSLMALGGGLIYSLLFLCPFFEESRVLLFAAVWCLGYSCMTSMTPQIDAMTIALSQREGFPYTWPRAVGSMSFIGANIAVGFGLNLLGVDLILIWVVLLAFSCAFAARFILPPAPRLEVAPTVAGLDQTGWQRIKTLMGNPDFIWLMVAMGCIQAAHSFYYGFSSIIWKNQGFDGLTTGCLWAIGVAAEVLVLAYGLRLRRRFGAWWLLIAAGVLSVIRWGIMATTPPLWVLWPLQTLHAASFAAAYLAGLDLVQRLAPKGYESLAQTICAAYVFGVMMGLATLSSGPVYDVLGGAGYVVMAVLSAAGLLVSVLLYRKRKA